MPHSTDDDHHLALQARSDAGAFAELYRRYMPRVYRYHLARTGNVHDAEDLTSQTFLAALEGIASYRGRASFLSWLFGIAARRQALFFRRRRREVPLETASHLQTTDRLVEQLVESHLQIEHVARTLQQIAPDRAEAIRLCLFAGLSYREAAAVMHKSEAAVKMALSRGLRDLRERTSVALEVHDAR